MSSKPYICIIEEYLKKSLRLRPLFCLTLYCNNMTTIKLIIGAVLGVLWFIKTVTLLGKKSEKEQETWRKNTVSIIILISIFSKWVGSGILIGIGLGILGLAIFALVSGGFNAFKACIKAGIEAGKKALLDEKNDTTTKTEGAA